MKKQQFSVTKIAEILKKFKNDSSDDALRVAAIEVKENPKKPSQSLFYWMMLYETESVRPMI